MAYGTPADPVGGTVITVAYAVANILDPIRWLRLLTGNADPPGASYVVVSSSTTGTSWSRIPTDAINDGAITTAKVAALAITDALIASVSGAKINNASIPSGKHEASSIIGSDLADGNINLGTKGIAASLTGDRVANNTLNLGNVAQDGTLTTAKVAAAQITAALMAAGAAASNIGTGGVSAAMLAVGAALSNLGYTPARSASGTYTGNGASSARQITAGFACKFVLIHDTTADTFYVTINTTSGMRTSVAIPVQFQSTFHLHASDGFVVADGSTTANINTNSYAWSAFG